MQAQRPSLVAVRAAVAYGTVPTHMRPFRCGIPAQQGIKSDLDSEAARLEQALAVVREVSTQRQVGSTARRLLHTLVLYQGPLTW